MKVSYVVDNHTPSYGGPYTVISDQAYQLYKNGISVDLVYSSNSFTKFKRDYNLIFKNTDIVHIFGIWRPFQIKAFLAAKKNKKKIVISPLGALEPWSLQQSYYKKKLAWIIYQKKIIDNADFLHATSDMEKNNLTNLGIRKPIKVIGHGIKIYENSIKKQENIVKKAIFFSRIHKKKGLLELVKCWSKLDPDGWELNIYGPVSDKKYFALVRQEIEKKKIKIPIKLHNPIYDFENKKNIFLSSNLFILPSQSENFGMSILEALSIGIPVITTSSTPWNILNSINAGLVFSFSEENLTENLKKIFKMNISEIKRMGDNGRLFVEKNFDIKKLIHNYINFYKDIIE